MTFQRFKLVQDKPLVSSERASLEFGSEDIANTLAALIKDAPTPFTIGLFSPWGTGKSTIFAQLDSKLSEESELVIFDVWKYETDALRRSFLVDISAQLEQKGYVNKKYVNVLKEHLYKTTAETRDKFEIPIKKLLLAGLFYAVALFLAQFVIPIPSILGLANINKGLIAAGGSIILLMGTFASRLVDPDTFIQEITLAKSRIESPEEFEEEFRKILSKLKKKRLVVVIDNLDRAQKDKAVELLSTIKTYLNADSSSDDVVFLIACDDAAIREHITSVYGNKNSEYKPEEFLQKFFNLVLRVPKYLNSDVDEFIGKLLHETQIPVLQGNTSLQQIMNLAFTSSPREIKQFINSIVGYYVFAMHRVENGTLQKDFVDDNITFIAKLLIIRDKYPETYAAIEKVALYDAQGWSEIESRITTLVALSEPRRVAFEAFVSKTKWMSPTQNNIVPLLTLYRSADDIAIPGWDNYFQAAIARDESTAKKVYDTADKPSLGRQLMDKLKLLLEAPARMLPFIATTLQVLRQDSDVDLATFRGFFDLVAKNFPEGENLQSMYAPGVPRFVLTKVHELVGKTYQFKIDKAYTELLNLQKQAGEPLIDEDEAFEILAVIAGNADRFIVHRGVISSMIQSHYYFDLATMDAFSSSVESRSFVSSAAINALLGSISQEDIVDDTALLELEVALKYEIDDVQYLFKRLGEISALITSNGKSSDRIKFTNMLIIALRSYEEKVKNITDVSQVGVLSSSINHWDSEDSDMQNKIKYAEAAFLLKGIPSNPGQADLNRVLSSFMGNGSDEIEAFLAANNAASLVDEYPEQFKNSVVSNLSLLDLALRTLQVSHIENLIARLLEQARSADSSKRQEIYDTIIKILSMSKNVAIINQVYAELVNNVKPSDPAFVRKFVHKRLFDKKYMFDTNQRKRMLN